MKTKMFKTHVVQAYRKVINKNNLNTKFSIICGPIPFQLFTFPSFDQQQSLSLSLYIYIYIYVCVCVCVCVSLENYKGIHLWYELNQLIQWLERSPMARETGVQS